MTAAFDSTFRFLPLRNFDSVPGGHVVVLAPHPDDEVIGAGGAMAHHAARNDKVTVVHMTDGSGGDREGKARGAIADVRKQEARNAGRVLGVTEYKALDFPDGALRPEGAFLSGLTGALESLRPDVLYVPSPFEHHPDHRATLLLASRALDQSRLAPAVILYEVNEPQQAGYLLDITTVFDAKERALKCFASQQAYMDVVRKALTANRARTVNVDLAEVGAAEAYLQLDARKLGEWVEGVGALRTLLDELAAGPDVRSDATPSDAGPREKGESVAAVSCVISTWNKCDDVRENLLALHRQTMRPAEIVVVDNASSDGTAQMVLSEFPAVKLIRMPHSKFGACETFNIGMKAVSQPLTAIMDDDVVAPPDWIEKLVRRLDREPDTTAMISSNVIEPEMPEEFLAAERNERYMATFRGCGTLARSDVLRRAGYYDERFFIYGNERDLAARVLSLGFRILQYPDAEIFHKTPFGMKAGARSLYYHVRNFWLYAFKNCTVPQIVRASWVLAGKGLGLRGGGEGGGAGKFSADASGTIGIDRAVKETPRGLWIAAKATLAAIALLPYCLRRRQVCRSPDFVPPVQ